MQTLATVAGLFVCLYHLWSLIDEDFTGRERPLEWAMGRVVDVQVDDDDGSQTYAAVVRFESGSGPIEFVDGVWASSEPRIGRRVKVRFPIGHPQLAQVHRPGLRLVAYLVDTVLAATLVGILTGHIPSNLQ